jgi:hypothetical protein
MPGTHCNFRRMEGWSLSYLKSAYNHCTTMIELNSKLSEDTSEVISYWSNVQSYLQNGLDKKIYHVFPTPDIIENGCYTLD